MASIFLSYAREDVAKARTLAKCLERAGHSVWWDRHIHGGSEFSGEIEIALKQAELVVVLWSEAAIHSAWVRDEAAEGRDSGRLVPLLLDSNPPPLGFRQLQSISIAGWSGRGNPPEFAAIKAAIAKLSAPLDTPEAASAPAPRRRMVMAAIAVITALILAAAVGLLLVRGGSAKAESPIIAVLPFDDLSPQRDKAFLAEGVAEAILTVLAKEPGIKVIGRSSARQLHEAGADAPEMRRAMGITHVLEGSARSIGDQLRMSVRLVNASDGQQLWAEEYDRRLDNIFAVQDEIGRAVATKLRGSLGARAQGPQAITKADIYALYLAARSKMRDRRQSSLNEALKLVRRVMAADPDYAPGHAIYAEILNHLSSDNYGTIPDEQARSLAQKHARRAIELAPELADGYAALGLLLENEAGIAPLQKAIRLDPGRGELHNWLGHAFSSVGRHEEAMEQFRATLDMEPLWGPGISMVAYTLAASERYDEAEAELRRFEQRGGRKSIATKIRGDIAQYRGDFSEAVRLTELALRQDPETPQADLSAGWYYFLLGLHDDAARVSKRMPRNLRLAMTGQHNQLRSEARAAGRDFWAQSEPDIAVDALAIARDWGSIAALHDINPGIRSAICGDPERIQTGLNLAMALKQVGRADVSKQLQACVRSQLERHGRGPIFAPYLPAGTIDLFWAELHAVEGRGETGVPLLNRSIDRGIRTPYGRGLDDFPLFDGVKHHPDYAKIDARMKRLIAMDRAEALAWKRRAA